MVYKMSSRPAKTLPWGGGRRMSGEELMAANGCCPQGTKMFVHIGKYILSKPSIVVHACKSHTFRKKRQEDSVQVSAQLPNEF